MSDSDGRDDCLEIFNIMLALFLLTFYLLWTVETIKTKTLGKSLKLPAIACIVGCITYLINIQTSIAYLTIISIASFIFIYKKASSMEDVEMYYVKRKT
jgi:hypothetical protein